jgi:ribosomal protein S18 acetylase RimI-like enzyme
MTTEQPIIRRATLDDVAAITALTDAAYRKYIPQIGRKPQPMTTDYTQVVTQHPVWLVEVEQHLVGVLVLQHEVDSLLIYSVAINPSDQKRGFGRLLLGWAEHQAQQVGYRSLRLYTNALMKDNIALYTRLGYREMRREAYGSGEIVHMTKQLVPESSSS